MNHVRPSRLEEGPFWLRERLDFKDPDGLNLRANAPHDSYAAIFIDPKDFIGFKLIRRAVLHLENKPVPVLDDLTRIRLGGFFLALRVGRQLGLLVWRLLRLRH